MELVKGSCNKHNFFNFSLVRLYGIHFSCDFFYLMLVKLIIILKFSNPQDSACFLEVFQNFSVC